MTEERLPQEIRNLAASLEAAQLPPELKLKASSLVESLGRSFNSVNYVQEAETARRFLSWVISLPWNKFSADNLDLKKAREILDRNHYALLKIKERILEYVAVLNLTENKAQKESSVLCFTGLPGLGKTSVAASIADTLGRKFIRIPFGGLSDVSQIRGLPRYLPASEPGQVIKGLRRAGTANPVILLDEIDRVDDASRGMIMGALLELLDPEQNNEFTDYYIDYPFNLSRTLFICTANNTRGIANAVLDRLEAIEMPSYTDDDKTIIGKKFLLPKAMKLSGLKEGELKIDDELWPKIIRPLGYDAGIRTLERTIEGICRKVARAIVEDRGREFAINEKNVKEFLPT